jgi:cellobiose epimerase
MKKNIIILIILVFTSIICNCQTIMNISKENKAKLEQLKKEVTENLTGNILPYWSQKMTDNVNGGFYGRADWSDKVYPDADKGGILNARILWTYSSVYRIMHDTSCLRLATRSKDYIFAHFIDNTYGGVYMSVSPHGDPADERKQTYTQSFFIYGLAEYYRATGDREALKKAMEIFAVLEKNASDSESNGYFEVFSRDWKRLHDRLIGEPGDKAEKTMNTHLHIMEAYANLYRVSHDKTVGDRLRNLVDLFLDKIVSKKTSHLICFLDRNWNPASDVDSYGHDIESSWLLYEAAGLLGDEKLMARAKETCLKIADAASEGIQTDGGMITEKDNSTGRKSIDRSWWEQAETVIGNLNAFELTGEEKYLNRSVRCWDYTKHNFVDYKNGGWYSYVTESGIPMKNDKAGFWVCPYHNSRMCLEVIERVKE